MRCSRVVPRQALVVGLEYLIHWNLDRDATPWRSGVFRWASRTSAWFSHMAYNAHPIPGARTRPTQVTGEYPFSVYIFFEVVE